MYTYIAHKSHKQMWLILCAFICMYTSMYIWVQKTNSTNNATYNKLTVFYA